MRNDAPGQLILSQWRRLSAIPGGGWLFSKVLGWQVPYSGSVSPRVLVLEPGLARVRITERRALRQHLGSVHAIALMNVAELASGLAMMGALPAGMRGIVTKIGIEYFKKARGVLVAESRCAVAPDLPEGEYDFTSDVKDAAGDVVARATVTWKLGPVPVK
jgi:acyl-coenzyme A thioesterase PaaI-like protein